MSKKLNKVKTAVLPFVVFLTGACILVIEIVANRILSPYYGNTIFTVSSVISIVLAALSVGYYFGGKLADKYPSEKLFYSIIFSSGLSVILLYVLNLTVLPAIGYKISAIYGPIILATILFFVPSVILGTLSPFAIKLQRQHFPRIGIGSITGGIFFWSTLGSILGSLLAGFVLIPNFGIDRIILGVALILIFLGIIPIAFIGFKKKILFKIIFLLSAGFFLINRASNYKSEEFFKNVIYSKNGVYEKITINDDVVDGRPIRFFFQDRSLSGAVYLDSDELVFDFAKYYILYKVFDTEVNQALVIGGGSYTIPNALINALPKATVDVSEIEPSLYDLAQKYFNIKKSDRLNNYIVDGRRFLHDSDKKYDYIYSDVFYTIYSIPTHFTTREFFTVAKSKLEKNGIFIINVAGELSRQKSSLVMAEIKTFKSVFPNSYFFAVYSPAQFSPQNIIFVAHNSDNKIDFTDPKFLNDNDPFIKSLHQKAIDLDRFELSDYPILTDNFTKGEYFTIQLLKSRFGEQKVIRGEEIISLIDQQKRYNTHYQKNAGTKKAWNFMVAEVKALTDEIEIKIENRSSRIIGKVNPEAEKRILLSTYYDAASPPTENTAANISVLFELVRSLVNLETPIEIGVDLVLIEKKNINLEDQLKQLDESQNINGIFFDIKCYKKTADKVNTSPFVPLKLNVISSSIDCNASNLEKTATVTFDYITR